jgi:hypothetical protein
MTKTDQLAEAMRFVFVSPNVSDSNFEAANIVDVIDKVACGLFAIRNAIVPSGVGPGRGADGTGLIESLTEAVMDTSQSLRYLADQMDFGDVAGAIRELAEAVRERGK